MTFEDLQTRAISIRKKYVEFEKQKYGRGWTEQEMVLGLMGDIGKLAKLAQAKSGVRDIEDVDEKLAHELSDCLWSVMVLADKYGVDLETSFVATMNQLEDRINRGESH